MSDDIRPLARIRRDAAAGRLPRLPEPEAPLPRPGHVVGSALAKIKADAQARRLPRQPVDDSREARIAHLLAVIPGVVTAAAMEAGRHH